MEHAYKCIRKHERRLPLSLLRCQKERKNNLKSKSRNWNLKIVSWGIKLKKDDKKNMMLMMIMMMIRWCDMWWNFQQSRHSPTDHMRIFSLVALHKDISCVCVFQDKDAFWKGCKGPFQAIYWYPWEKWQKNQWQPQHHHHHRLTALHTHVTVSRVFPFFFLTLSVSRSLHSLVLLLGFFLQKNLSMSIFV